MQNDKLLPCPFCGGEAEIKKTTVQYNHDKTRLDVYVCCKICGANTGTWCDNEIGAINKWNRRKPMERIIEQLEEQIDNNRGWEDEDYFNGEISAYKHAIEIVKGGVDNATN